MEIAVDEGDPLPCGQPGAGRGQRVAVPVDRVQAAIARQRGQDGFAVPPAADRAAAYTAARELAKSPDAMIVKYGHEPSVLDLFGIEAESRSKTSVELQLPGASALPKLLPGQMYYLPPAFAH